MNNSKETKDSKVPFQTESGEKPKKKMYMVIVLLLVVIAILAFVLIKGKPGEGKLPAKMKLMQETAAQIQNLESEIQDKQNEVMSLMTEYKNKTGENMTDINIMNLTPPQKEILLDKIKNEKDISIKSLLQDILDKDNRVKELNEQVRKLENTLPKPVVADEGDNHYTLAMNYLLNEQNLSKKEAMKLVERTALYEPLIPGFKVWNFYVDGEYGTFITQGTASISPNRLQYKIKKDLTDARDMAIAQRDKLQADIDELDKRRSEMISQLELLNQEKGSLVEKMTELTSINEDLQRKINSVFFIIDTSRNLREAEILKAGFLRSTKLQSVPPEKFSLSIDLRKDTTISISAETLGIETIKSISFFPKFYVKDTDYSVAVDEEKRNAVITLLNDKKFRSERIVLAIN